MTSTEQRAPEHATPHSAATCRAQRHTRVQHLVTADEHSLVDLEVLLSTLPICATGRVFVEVPDAAWISDIAAPPRMVVTWLDRSARSGEPGSGRSCAPGAAIARAVTAWADEMLCIDDDETRFDLLGGYLGTADIVDHLTDRLGVGAERIHAPERFGLFSGRR
ncbi:SIP domain-containing protein [Microbacterium marinilacus]|uniref:SIP-like Rossmann fold domain-containing protein n=1 Tax=Microbacterium marinilacus TaxID=415209 RepID=A0ABP7B4X5_9MICO|nr:SIP domain-containing protein [Microbacterium marinilacus]MBY0690014.1 siderophore-interacting protein [Microbacterium marinilacus]